MLFIGGTRNYDAFGYRAPRPQDLGIDAFNHSAYLLQRAVRQGTKRRIVRALLEDYELPIEVTNKPNPLDRAEVQRSEFEAIAKTGLKGRLWLLLEEPGSSQGALLVAVANMVLIVMSCVAFIAESDPELYSGPGEEPRWVVFGTDGFKLIEYICIGPFTLDFATRMWCSSSTVGLKSFCGSSLNWVDFIAIAPFYLDLLGADLDARIVRLIRIFRVFRMFKLGKHSSGLKIFVATMRASAASMYMMGLLVMIAVVVISAMLFFAERGSWDAEASLWRATVFLGPCRGLADESLCKLNVAGQLPSSRAVAFPSSASGCEWASTRGMLGSGFFPGNNPYDELLRNNITVGCIPAKSQFQDIPSTFYWAITTMTTCGYGDIVALTGLGKFLSAMYCIVGIVTIALPISVIQNNFNKEYYKYTVAAGGDQLEFTLAELGMSHAQMQNLKFMDKLYNHHLEQLEGVLNGDIHHAIRRARLAMGVSIAAWHLDDVAEKLGTEHGVIDATSREMSNRRALQAKALHGTTWCWPIDSHRPLCAVGFVHRRPLTF